MKGKFSLRTCKCSICEVNIWLSRGYPNASEINAKKVISANSTDPDYQGLTICHTNHIYIYIMHLHHQNVPTHQVHVQTGHTQTCTICHITHSHVITSPQWPFILGQKLYTLPEWPMYWDRSVCTNSADTDLIRVCTIWHTANIYMLYLRIVESTCSSLSVVTIWQNA